MKKIFISSQSYVPFHVGSEASGKIWLSLLRLPSLDHLLLQAYSSSLRRHFMASQPTNDEDQQPLSFPTSLISPLCSVIYTLPAMRRRGSCCWRYLSSAESSTTRLGQPLIQPVEDKEAREGRKEGLGTSAYSSRSSPSFLSLPPMLYPYAIEKTLAMANAPCVPTSRLDRDRPKDWPRRSDRRQASRRRRSLRQRIQQASPRTRPSSLP
jgi:hypothetical protein